MDDATGGSRPPSTEVDAQCSAAADPRVAADPRIVLVSGRAGAGRSTAIKTLEDIGFETVDTPPLAFVPAIVQRLLDAGHTQIAIGVDSRTLCFGDADVADALRTALQEVREAAVERTADADAVERVSVLFLDCADDVLIRRYTETRRRHPLAPHGAIEEGLAQDRRDVQPLREAADIVIDTSNLTQADLRREVAQRFDRRGENRMSISVASFSYRRGLPPGADLVFDCRFLRNPHYVESLRELDGRAPEVAQYVAEDARYAPFMAHLDAFAETLLPAYRAEGKSYLTIAFGCTGGKHRSVAVAEDLAARLRARGWRIHLRHRERSEETTSAAPPPSDPAPGPQAEALCDDAA